MDNTAALGSYSGLGFTLHVPDDHFLLLFHDDERIAVFSQIGATPESLRSQCAGHLLTHHRSTVHAGEPVYTWT